MKNNVIRLWCLISVSLYGVELLSASENKLLTIAEKSGFKQTSTHAEVMSYCKALAQQSSVVHLDELGKSVKGKSLPLLIVSNPAIKSATEAKKSGKLILFVLGNIHAGEVAGKEGVLMLLRDLTLRQPSPLLKDVVLLVAPIFNADGNDDMAKDNRPGQVGPAKMGTRHNAQGFDLNRDFVKIESPEVKALIGAFNEWDPAVFIDLHTTNGSKHRYTLTYDGPRHPAGDATILKVVRDRMLPAIGEKLFKRSGYRSFYYGNFDRERKQWTTYPALPRYGIAYVGLRNRISILSEAYSYATYKDRVLVSRDFVLSCLEYFVENRKTVHLLLEEADRRTVQQGQKPRGDDQIALRFRPAPSDKKFKVLGYENDNPKDYQLTFLGLAKPTLSVSRPFAYLIPSDAIKVIEKLQQHGIQTEYLNEDTKLHVEICTITKIQRSIQNFQKHHLTLADVKSRQENLVFKSGTIIVRTAQPLGSLACYLLEPTAEDGFVAWNFFDEQLKVGRDFPVNRLQKPTLLKTSTKKFQKK